MTTSCAQADPAAVPATWERAERTLPPAAAVEAHLESRRVQCALKRTIDVVVASVALVAVLPLLALAAVAIRATSRGPILFSQPRAGRGGSQFVMYKLRSMHAEASATPHHDGRLDKMPRDPRVTPVGALLRRTSIDELPQLFCVIRGDMSLVGPRPLMPHMLEPYPEFAALRGLVRPGITGLWQIRDRARSTSAAFMIAHDVEYLLTLGLLQDARILLATVRAVFTARGAY